MLTTMQKTGSHIAGGNINDLATLENSLEVSFKIKNWFTIWPNNDNLGYFTAEKWKLKSTQKPMHKCSK